VCDLENLKNEVAMTRVGSQRHKKNTEGRIILKCIFKNWDEGGRTGLIWLRIRYALINLRVPLNCGEFLA
jgi:hypothetical protein